MQGKVARQGGCKRRDLLKAEVDSQVQVRLNPPFVKSPEGAD